MRYSFLSALAIAVILTGCAGSSPTTRSTMSSSLPQSSGLPPVDTAAAQHLLSPDEILQTLDFPASGTKTLSGRIEGYKTVAYALPVRQGQRLEVTMESPSSSAYFNIYDAKDTSGAAIFAGETAGTNTALIRVNGDATYVIRPFLVRAVARRGQSANYTLKIERQ